MALANKIPVPGPVLENLGRVDTAPGLYVHVPFCAHACDFCAFYQVEPRRADIDLYLETIECEMDLFSGHVTATETAFWGGGTPSVLPARDLERLAAAQVARFGRPRREWTVELAPGSVKADKLRVLREAGVTRVSLGVQSFSPTMLEALGRRHALAQIRAAWALIEEAGIRSRNVDLIFAVPGQELPQWREDLDEAARLGVDHISTYCLTFEEDTAMYARLSRGAVSIDTERERAFLEATWDRLAELGYAQYEISNHARPGHASVHNLDTWRMRDWIGLGPSAASQWRGLRGTNAPDLAAWAGGVRRGERANTERLELNAAQLAEDALIFGLRMNEGVDLGKLEARFGVLVLEPFAEVIERIVGDDLATLEPGRKLRLTREGRLVADAVGAEFVGRAAMPRG